jgi:carbamoyltransferase
MIPAAASAVIGIWDGHDAGAALVVEGRVVLALNEERLSGRKLDAGFPHRAIAKVRAAAGDRPITWAVTTSDPSKTLTRLLPGAKERHYRLRRRLEPPGWATPWILRAKYSLTQLPTCDWLRGFARLHFSRTLGVSRELVHIVDHHAAHAAAAAFWPDHEKDLVVVTLDGIGDGLSGSVWRWSRASAQLHQLLTLHGSASFGLFFEHVTQALQMRPLEDEGKVMALATYALNTPASSNPFLPWFKLETDAAGMPRLQCTVAPRRMAAEVERIVWCHPREQVCRFAQQVLEERVPAFFARLAAVTGCGNFAYAGGVASNIKVNRLIRTLPGVNRLFVCPAMGDGGLPLGAALFLWHRLSGRPPMSFDDFRLGPDHGDLGEHAEQFLPLDFATVRRPDDLPLTVAQLLARGEVVMWAQGRMELGPRALGSRSIIARADRVEIRDELNVRLKRRAWFQPFCPSMLATEATRLLSDYRGEHDLNRHMTMGFGTTPAGREALAGAIGPDGSCRPQLVDDAAPSEPWFSLLKHMKHLTGTGAVINTSLNLHGHPMADSSEDIIAAWKQSDIRYLALGSMLLARNSNPALS